MAIHRRHRENKDPLTLISVSSGVPFFLVFFFFLALSFACSTGVALVYPHDLMLERTCQCDGEDSF